MKLTISDIAKLANVSVSTVSIVLNNKTGVSKKTREKVLNIIEKYNYNPNQIAQSLASKETKSFGLIIKEIDNPYFSKVMKGVYDKAWELGYSVLLGSSELIAEKETEIINTMLSKRVDGLIISPIQNDEANFISLANLTKNNIPLVVLGMIDNTHFNSVDIDNKKAAFEAVTHLIKLGHEHIAYFGGPSHSGHAQKRLLGYQTALNTNGIPINEQYIIEVGPNIEDSFKIAFDLFSNTEELPTAVFCYNDLAAIGVISALEKLDLQVPEDVSVFGFDNIDFGKYLKLPLSTIELPAYQIGEEAVKLLIDVMHSNSELKNKKVILNHSLVKRNTCAPPNQKLKLANV
ncbi:MAG: LacI family DNA-binding transcriptional regulator [Ignavibacteriales bacterium]|nr:LacI family DNA-binding transcriptional regulator [Ignavibacteriota bacterium]MCB9247557.1 LacI family DNA-binding transcriptional regulator [Ignavibacteriales bacterium]